MHEYDKQYKENNEVKETNEKDKANALPGDLSVEADSMKKRLSRSALILQPATDSPNKDKALNSTQQAFTQKNTHTPARKR